MKYWQYLKYIIRHKWFVFQECVKLGIPVLGITHDLSKFSLDEWIPYARYFYGNYTSIKDTHGDVRNWYLGAGNYKEKVEEEFNFAWSRHQHRNKHHWQHWVIILDDGGKEILKMPDKYVREMLADWRGAGKAQGFGDNTKEWYLKRRDTMLLHEMTRMWIERELGI